MKKKEGGPPSKGTGLSVPSTKRKPFERTNRPLKKPKVMTRSAADRAPDVRKLPHQTELGKGQGLMTCNRPVTEKCLVLLREDSTYVLKQLSSIIKDDDYEDLGNHATQEMGETGLFSLAQVYIRPSILPSCYLFTLLNLVFYFYRGCL